MSNVEQRLPDFDPHEFVVSLLSRYERDPDQFHISQEYMERCTGPLGEVKPERFNALALALAHGYHDGKLSFAFCDLIVNIMVEKVYSDAVAQRDTWPFLFWEVYLAFDAGEFVPPGERHIDPTEKYTKPLIAAIVAQKPV
ncbi:MULTISPECIES: hypothetical protein [Burkholderia cepacia complex]|uniref:Uncharacterized protein n=1 Tax=Burkholderia cepacia TaxID=292 RepID=A0A1B4Q1C0_BURCE|nr:MULTISPECIES: hypothetical protein [Burkholderia cepacia complex]AOK19974.1 hypothetical protein WT26_29595 [Burkholderia cepacia]